VTSSWFFLSTLNYDAWSTAHQIYIVFNTRIIFNANSVCADHNSK